MAKKSIKLLTTALSLALVLTACSGGGTSSQSTPTPANSPSSEQSGSSQAEREVKTQQLTIGTASAGGAYYPIGTGIAEVITSHVKPLTVSAEITGGSVENPRLVGLGDADIGISNADHATFAIQGAAPFDKAYDISALGSLHASVLHIVTLEGSGINSIEDLKGQKIAVGPAGGASIVAIQTVLEAYGINFDDITPNYLSYDDGMSQLKDGQVKVALAQSGYPAAAVMSLSATDKVKILSISDEKMLEISKKNPFYSKVIIDKEIYKTTEPITVLGVRNLIFCNPSMDNDTAYAITEAIYGNLEELKSYHNSLSGVTLDTVAETSGVKMHPGAEAYFKDAGLLK